MIKSGICTARKFLTLILQLFERPVPWIQLRIEFPVMTFPVVHTTCYWHSVEKIYYQLCCHCKWWFILRAYFSDLLVLSIKKYLMLLLADTKKKNYIQCIKETLLPSKSKSNWYVKGKLSCAKLFLICVALLKQTLAITTRFFSYIENNSISDHGSFVNHDFHML